MIRICDQLAGGWIRRRQERRRAIAVLPFLMLAAVAALPVAAQTKVAPDCVIDFSFTAAGQNSGGVGTCGNNTAGVVQWTLWYKSTGFSALSLRVESAPDNGGAPGTWVAFAGMTVAGANPNTATTQNSTMLSGFEPWVRVILTSKTGTGTITGQLYGCRQPGCAGGIEVVTAILGISDVNLVEVAGAPTAANAGTADAGTLRVVVATDQPAFTNPVPTDEKRLGGVAIDLNAGTAAGGTQRIVLATDQPAFTNPVPTDEKRLGGNTIDLNTGLAGGGTQRVVLATDQAALTNPVPTDEKRLGGVAIDLNTGAAGGGTQRVVLATDQAALTNPVPTDEKRLGGVAIDLNAGNAGGGTQRVVLATDQAVIGAKVGTRDNSTTILVPSCQIPIYSANLTAAATTKIVTGTAAQRIHLCVFGITLAALGTFGFTEGTGTNCGTGTLPLTQGATLAVGVPFVMGSGFGQSFQTSTLGADLCVTLTGVGATAQVFATFDKF